MDKSIRRDKTGFFKGRFIAEGTGWKTLQKDYDWNLDLKAGDIQLRTLIPAGLTTSLSSFLLEGV